MSNLNVSVDPVCLIHDFVADYWNLVNMARRYIHYMSPRRVDETCKLECNIYRRNSFRSCLHLQLRLVKVLDYVGILLDS